MNCVEMNCVHCKARDIPCNIHISKDTVCDKIIDIYCELGHTCYVPFNDEGDRVYCKDYAKRRRENEII